MKETMSYHCEVTRANRVQNIVEKIGIGQIVMEKYIHSIDQIQAGQAGKYVCITDTGVTIIKSEDKQTIITMYVTTQNELVRVYGGRNKVPKFLIKKVDHNQSLFTQAGKTIWR